MFGRAWTNEEWQFVVDNYHVMRLKDIATRIGRSKDTILKKLKREGIIEQYRDLPPIEQEDGSYLILLNSHRTREQQYAIVDAIDLPIVSQHRWHIVKNRNTDYAYTCLKQETGGHRNVGMHTLIIRPVKGFEIDHKDRNGLNLGADIVEGP